MMIRINILLSGILLTTIFAASVFAQTQYEAATGDPTHDIRLMLTAPDNQLFDKWTTDEIIAACYEIYYKDPETAPFHDQVVGGSVILIGRTGDKRAIPLLKDAIETHAPQALYALGNFPYPEAVDALTANVRNEDESARENAAEGLRRLPMPKTDDVTSEWVASLKKALTEVNAWIPKESDPDFLAYFKHAKSNLEWLIEKSAAVMAD